MLSYRVMLDVPLQLAAFVSGLLAEHRRELGTRDGTRALTCWKQTVFTLAWFRDRPDVRRLGARFGISQAPRTGTRMRQPGCSRREPRPFGRPGAGRLDRGSVPDPGWHADLLRSVREKKKVSRKGKEIDA